MPRNLESTLCRSKWVWRQRGQLWVSFPTLPRAFVALGRLEDQYRLAEYDGYSNGRHWVHITDPEPGIIVPNRG